MYKIGELLETEWGDLRSWRISPADGYAHVDGVFVETDTFADPRSDRVFPILIEEQPCMWLLLRRLLRQLTAARGREGASRPISVLDVGTGSGFFSLLCARHFGCSVVAVDVSPRALEFARKNARANGLEVSASLVDGISRKGHIHLAEGDIADWATMPPIAATRGFDIVLLTPPYNPTHPALDQSVAKHAGAGELGQDSYQAQIDSVAHLLKPGGLCIINHLSTFAESDVELTRETQWWNRGGGSAPSYYISRNLSPDYYAPDQLCSDALSSLFAVECLRNTVGLGENASVTVVPGLSTAISTREFIDLQYADIWQDLPGFEHYWKRAILGSRGRLAYVFMVVQSEAGTGWRVQKADLAQGSSPERVHGKTWHDRARTHRQVVNHTESFSTRSVLGLVVPSADRFAPLIDPVISQQLKGNHLLKSPETNLRVFWEIDRYIRHEGLGTLFPTLLVNATPIHGSTHLPLSQECAAWHRGEWCVGPNRPAPNLDVLGAWLTAVMKLQQSCMAPFANPAFYNPVNWCQESGWPQRWPELYASRLPYDDRLYRAGRLHELVARWTAKASFNQPTEKTIPSGFSGNVSPWAAIATSKLSDLDVQEKVAYDEAFVERISEISEVLGGDYDDAGLNEEQRHSEAARLDIRLCYHILHQQLAAVQAEQRGHDLGGDSLLVAVPVGTLFYDSLRSSCFPRHYKGAFWVLYGGVHNWGKEHEKSAWDFIRYIWLLLSGDYDAQSEMTQADRELSDFAFAFGHETKKIADALSQKWLLELPPTGHLPNDLKSLSPPPKLVPYPDILSATGRLLRLWSFVDDAERIFEPSPPPRDLSGMVRETFALAKDTLKPLCCFFLNSRSAMDRRKMGEYLKQVNALWPSREDCSSQATGGCLVVTSAGVRIGEWSSLSPELRTKWMLLVRLLVALFGNCVRHADPRSDIEIVFMPVEGQDYLKLNIENAMDKPKENGLPPVLQQAREALAATYAPGKGEFKGRHVVETLVRQLRGQIASWGPGPLGATFSLEILISKSHLQIVDLT